MLRETVVRAIEKTNDGLIAVDLGDGEALEADAVHVRDRPGAEHPRPRPGGGRRRARRRMAPSSSMTGTAARCRTSIAVGDCTDRVNLTPVAIAEGHAFAETHFHDNPIRVDLREHSVGGVQPAAGGRRRANRDAGALRGPIDVYVSRFRPMRHTLSGRDESTLMKIVVCADDRPRPRLPHGRGGRAGDHPGVRRRAASAGRRRRSSTPPSASTPPPPRSSSRCATSGRAEPPSICRHAMLYLRTNASNAWA